MNDIKPLIVALAAITPAVSFAAPPPYKLTDLGAIPDDFISFTGKGLDLNSKGHIAGASNANPNVIAQIGIPGDGVIDANATLGGNRSVANAINESDHLAGDSETSNGEFHAFLWNGTDMIDLGTLGGETSWSLAINDSSQVTGAAETEAGAFHAYFWDGEIMHDIGTLGGGRSDGRGVSSNGFVTGIATVSDSLDNYHAFLWDGDTMEDLGTLGGPWSSGESVNVHGMVAGQSSRSDGSEHAMLWNGTEMIDLGTLQGHQTSIAHRLNSDGTAVGWSSTRLGNDVSAFVWRDGVMTELPSPYEFTQAWFINDDGQIFGYVSSGPSVAPRIVRWDPATREVAIDIKPGDVKNRINPRAKGFLWVAVLSETDASSAFDPVSEVNVSSAQFGPAGAVAARSRKRDVNKDGIADLLLQFALPEAGIVCGTDEATLIAEMLSGEVFAGTGSVRTVGCR